MKVSSLIAAVLFAGTTMTGIVFADEKAAAPKAASPNGQDREQAAFPCPGKNRHAAKSMPDAKPISPMQPRIRASISIREMESKRPVKAPESGPHHFSHGYPQTSRARRSVCVSHTGAGGQV